MKQNTRPSAARHASILLACILSLSACDSSAITAAGGAKHDEFLPVLGPTDGGMPGGATPDTGAVVGAYALTHINGQPLPVLDPYRTDGTTIQSGSMYVVSPNNRSANVFYYCLSDGNRYQANFTYERVNLPTTAPEYIVYAFPVSESGYLSGNVFMYSRYHPDPALDPLQYTFDKSVARTC